MSDEQLNRRQEICLDAAMRLTQLSIEDSLRINAVLSRLADDLFQDSVGTAEATADSVDTRALMGLRLEQVQRTAQMLADGAREIAETGKATRSAFSRLLTEQLAAGSHGLSDAFQSYFEVLPGRQSDFLASIEEALTCTNNAINLATHVSAVTALDASGERPDRRRLAMNEVPSLGLVVQEQAEPTRRPATPDYYIDRRYCPPTS